MNTAFFKEILSIDSTSGNEPELRERVAAALGEFCPDVRVDQAGNLIALWGSPKVVFCSHLDTVPPYIAPIIKEGIAAGRGTCDAKGQWMGMIEACRMLSESGQSGFALLLTVCEETGSVGAKGFDLQEYVPEGADVALLVGEPTESRFVSAAKGTKSFDIVITGKACHSGYPGKGVSAIDLFHDFYGWLKSYPFAEDPLMGATTWNAGRLESANAKNVLSARVSFELFFRTTASTDSAIEGIIAAYAAEHPEFSVTFKGGDTPLEYFVPEGYEGAPVAFGTDAPHLKGFSTKSIYGPGSILDAHTDGEKVVLADIEKAVGVYVDFFKKRTSR